MFGGLAQQGDEVDGHGVGGRRTWGCVSGGARHSGCMGLTGRVVVGVSSAALACRCIGEATRPTGHGDCWVQNMKMCQWWGRQWWLRGTYQACGVVPVPQH